MFRKRWVPGFGLFLYIIAISPFPVLTKRQELIYRDNDSCKYKIHIMSQYDRYTIKWHGYPFTNWCSVGFVGENPYNVHTRYRVCVSGYTKFRQCGPRVEFYDGFSIRPSERFGCGFDFNFKKKWCSSQDRLLIKIIAKEKGTSSLMYEVTIEADVSLPIWAAVAIAIGGFVAVFLTSWYCYCRYCLVEKESSRNNEDWESTQQSKLFTEISNSQNTIPLNTMGHQSNHDESDTCLLRELGDPSNKLESQGRVVSDQHNYAEGFSRNMQMEPHQSLPSAPPPSYQQIMKT